MTGIPCPKCGATDYRTLTTRKQRGKVVRVRRCLACGHTIRTAERLSAAAHRTKSVTPDTSPRRTP